MDHVYAVGASFIEYIQYMLQDYESMFRLVNEISNPHYVLSYVMPLVSIVDAVFAAQLTLCMAFGTWLNSVMKWWLLEDRPYWWIQTTDFYPPGVPRPTIRQTIQTCETGPGCPSGHSQTMAMFLVLTICWWAHYMNDKNIRGEIWKLVWYPVCFFSLGVVMVARVYVGAHFPHQVLLGALLGGILSPFLTIYVTDPYIWQYGCLKDAQVMSWHVASVAATISISIITFFSLKLCGFDPMWTVNLAMRCCESPDNVSVTTSPLFALASSTGHMLGWAISVTPAVKEYRHYTQNRSLALSLACNILIGYASEILYAVIKRHGGFSLYFMIFCFSVLRVPLLLRVVPAFAMYKFKCE